MVIVAVKAEIFIPIPTHPPQWENNLIFHKNVKTARLHSQSCETWRLPAQNVYTTIINWNKLDNHDHLSVLYFGFGIKDHGMYHTTLDFQWKSHDFFFKAQLLYSLNIGFSAATILPQSHFTITEIMLRYDLHTKLRTFQICFTIIEYETLFYISSFNFNFDVDSKLCNQTIIWLCSVPVPCSSVIP